MMVSKRMKEHYYGIYPEYTKKSIDLALSKQTKPSAIYTDFLLRPKDYSGLGMGVLRKGSSPKLRGFMTKEKKKVKGMM